MNVGNTANCAHFGHQKDRHIRVQQDKCLILLKDSLVHQSPQHNLHVCTGGYKHKAVYINKSIKRDNLI